MHRERQTLLFINVSDTSDADTSTKRQSQMLNPTLKTGGCIKPAFKDMLKVDYAESASGEIQRNNQFKEMFVQVF